MSATISGVRGTCDWCHKWFEELIRIAYCQACCEHCYPEAYAAAIKSHPEWGDPANRERPVNPAEFMDGHRRPQFDWAYFDLERIEVRVAQHLDYKRRE